MKLFSSTDRTTDTDRGRVGEPSLRDILTGPDTPHRRELETMLEDGR